MSCLHLMHVHPGVTTTLYLEATDLLPLEGQDVGLMLLPLGPQEAGKSPQCSRASGKLGAWPHADTRHLSGAPPSAAVFILPGGLENDGEEEGGQ